MEFLKRYHPEDAENFKMLALGFDMHYEIAQEYEASATSSMRNIMEKIRGMLLAFCDHQKSLKVNVSTSNLFKVVLLRFLKNFGKAPWKYLY